MRARQRVPVCVAAAALSAAVSGNVRAQWVEDDCTAIHTLTGEMPGDQFGWVANPIGDVTGDGVSDFVTTAPTNDAGGANAGRIYVHDGATGAELWRITGGNAGGRLGADADRCGDVNGDGVPDVIAGAPSADAGQAFLHSGADGSLIHTFDGEAVGDEFGFATTGGGDFDGDGAPDLLVTARRNDAAGDNAGRAYVYSGDDFSLICTIDGLDAGDQFGSAAAFAGDVNRDGRDDVIVGAQSAGSGGQAYVYGWDGAACQIIHTLTPPGGASSFGLFFVDGRGDVDADGTPDLYVSDFAFNRAYVYSGDDGSLIREFDGNGEGGGFGIGRIIPDIDRDGHADLVLAAWISPQGATRAGKAFIYSGADASVLRTMTYTVPFAGFGFDAAGMMGDVNGDGALDFLITAASEDSSTGKTFVMAGIPADSTDVCPDGFTRLRGLPVSGDVGSLCEDDDDRLVTRPDVFVPTTTPPVQIEVEGTSPVDAPGSLSFTLESHVSVNNIQQRLLLFDFDEQAYVLVDTRIAPTSDESVEVAVEDPSVFIESGTGRVRALVQYVQVAFSILPTWQARIDRAVWTVGD